MFQARFCKKNGLINVRGHQLGVSTIRRAVIALPKKPQIWAGRRNRERHQSVLPLLIITASRLVSCQSNSLGGELFFLDRFFSSICLENTIRTDILFQFYEMFINTDCMNVNNNYGNRIPLDLNTQLICLPHCSKHIKYI